MNVTYVPLIQRIRPLYDLPCDPALRFPFYITQVRGGETIGCPPLVAYNPMGKAHIATYIDALLDFDVDALAQSWIDTVPSALTNRLNDYHLGIAVVDDVAGGWTERSAYEMNERLPQVTATATASWLTTMLYASESVGLDSVANRVKATVVRAAIMAEYGVARTVRQMLAQEARVYQYVSAPFGCDDDEYAYTEAVIGPYLDAVDYPTQVAVLLGDDMARRNGFLVHGFGAYAGLAWAARRGYVD